MSFSFPTETISEGVVQIVVPRLRAFVKKSSDYAPSKAPVFYNPAMELNRDLAVLALQAYQRLVGRELVVCEPLTGCGIRGIRLAKEVDGVGEVVINDISREAYQLAKFNVMMNGVVDKVAVENEDANLLLNRFAAPRKRFDFVDVDPFGSPMPYVDSGLRALRRGGLLALTATDVAPLCGLHPKACVRRYFGKPLRTEYCHELAMRLIAGALARSAAKYDVSINVIFCHSFEHYLRLYAIVDHGATKANASLKNLGYVSHCFACFHREVSAGMFQYRKESCSECNSTMDTSGPLWIGEIVNKDFAASMEKEAKTRDFKEKRKIRRLLILSRKEAGAAATYYAVDRICDRLDVPVPSIERVLEELRKMSHKATLTHFRSQGIKTDASAEAVKKAIAMCID